MLKTTMKVGNMDFYMIKLSDESMKQIKNSSREWYQ